MKSDSVIGAVVQIRVTAMSPPYPGNTNQRAFGKFECHPPAGAHAQALRRAPLLDDWRALAVLCPALLRLLIHRRVAVGQGHRTQGDGALRSRPFTVARRADQPTRDRHNHGGTQQHGADVCAQAGAWPPPCASPGAWPGARPVLVCGPRRQCRGRCWANATCAPHPPAPAPPPCRTFAPGVAACTGTRRHRCPDPTTQAHNDLKIRKKAVRKLRNFLSKASDGAALGARRAPAFLPTPGRRGRGRARAWGRAASVQGVHRGAGLAYALASLALALGLRACARCRGLTPPSVAPSSPGRAGDAQALEGPVLLHVDVGQGAGAG